MRTAWWAVAAATSTLIAGAAQAQDFSRPNVKLLVVGKITIAETLAAFGPPYRQGPADDPAETVMIYRYDVKPEFQTPDAKIFVIALKFDSKGVLKEKHFYKLANDSALQ
jgi:hypothetical protein